jgi:S-DNA-T family DNA segregation ATPase FtsK/SpoIIIE
LVLQAPPDSTKPVPSGLATRLLPWCMALGSVGMVAVMGVANPTSWLFGGVFALSSIGLLAGSLGRGGARSGETDEDRRDYLRYLAQVRTRIRAIAAAQRLALDWTHPDPAVLIGVLTGDRLWERRATDPDFGQLRVGRGRQRLATRLVAPQTGPLEELEPVCAWSLRRLIRAHQIVPDLPLAVACTSVRRVCLRSTRPVDAAGPTDRELEPLRAVARAMLAQYTVWHSPADARLAVITSASDVPHWDWVKWLPHAQHPSLTDDVGALRLVTGDPAEVTEWLAAPGMAGSGEGDPPRLLVLVDGVDVRRAGAHWLDREEISVLRLARGDAAGERGELTLWADEDRVGVSDDRAASAQPSWIGRPDLLSLGEADVLARRMARFRAPRGAELDSGRPLRNTVGLPELLGMDGPASIDRARARWSGSPRDVLRVPIGVGESGEPVVLDLKESGQGGFGPHGLCIGATGSGKSELLRTLLLGLAATHSSERLNLVLVDFKGGATFLGMSRLPHVSAVITNLQDELELVDRMADALAGEIHRRQQVLRDAGNLTGVAQYESKRRRQPELPPLPALLIVVDEFSELLSQRPELVDLMVQIGRLGRSLQIHLLLASQRLDEGRLRGLESHLSYRIALRTFSPAESRAVLGVPDAYQLPPMPGSGFVALGTDELVRFRAAYVSGPAQDAVPVSASSRRVQSRPRRFTALRVGPAGLEDTDDPTEVIPRCSAPGEAPHGEWTELLDDPGSSTDTGTERVARTERDARTEREDGGIERATVGELMIAAMTGQGPSAHRVWLPPLDASPALDSLLPELESGQRGFGPPGDQGSLTVPIGLIDRPYHQRWDRHLVDLSGAEGHVLVVGAPRSGKSTVLRTVALGLALSNTPREVSFFALDFGGGMLNALGSLPHTAGVGDRQRPDLVRRTVAEVTALLVHRERAFRNAGLESATEFRARRADGGFPATAQDAHGDVFLLVDGYEGLREDAEELEAELLAIASRGLSYGVHLMISANRWIGVRPALKDLLGTRIELRLNDAGDSEIDRRQAVKVPAKPGRGLAPDGGQMIVARPELAAVGGGFADAVAAIAKAWPHEPVAKVRLLPSRLPHAEVLSAASGDPERPASPHAVAIGVDEARLAPVYLDFDTDPHLVCFADGESGKTNLLRLLARALTCALPPERARIVLIDYRRTMLDQVPNTHLIGYATTAAATELAVRDIADALRGRLPGPDTSPAQLRDRSWWTGPEVYVLVDDYDLVAGPNGGTTVNPLLPLVEFLPQAKDVGLHLVVLRRVGGAARALFEPVLGRLRELAVPVLVLSGSPDEGPLVEGLRAAPGPPGRGTLVSRRGGTRRIHLALLDPEPERTPSSAPR